MSAMTAEEIKALKGHGWLLNKGADTFSARIVMEIGKVSAEQMQAVAAAHQHGIGTVTLTVRQPFEVPGVPAESIEAFEGGMQAERFYVGWHGVTLPGRFKIGVGGCPNNCVKPNLNDAGIVGAVLPSGTRGCRITLGEHWGRTGAAVREGPTVLRDEESVLSFIETVLNFYCTSGQPHKRFFKTLERIGFEQALIRYSPNDSNLHNRMPLTYHQAQTESDVDVSLVPYRYNDPQPRISCGDGS